MTGTPASSLNEGRKVLGELILKLSPLGSLSNEAETRFHFLDEFLTACLGWDKQDIHVETHEQGDYTDYELGRPRSVIWEAKKAGLPFEFPVPPANKKPIFPIESLCAVDAGLKAAIIQCQQYCAKRGVPYGVVANGHQLVAFLGTRTDGIQPLKGRALAISSEEQLLSHFTTIWQALSYDGVAAQYLTQLLSHSDRKAGLPRKLSAQLLEYPRFRYRSNAQEDLRLVADLLLEDITTVAELEPEFYKQCYCESGALSNYALATKHVLQARYSALFPSGESAPTIAKINQDPVTGISNSDEVIAQALGKRPIVLIGDVGVGKTSFLKNLIYVKASGEFKNAVYVYIDLGSQGALEANLSEFFINEIERQLLERYEIDIYDRNFVKGVHDLDVKRFRNGLWGGLYETNREKYDEKLLEFLEAKISNKADHLRQSVHHISAGRKRNVVLIIDNADQRDLAIQQTAFVVAQNFSREWDAIVFIAVRPQTFHQSKRAGALSAYPPKVFSISPPRPEVLIEKRLVFALNMAEGRMPIERLQGIRLNVKGLALFIKALLHSLERNKEIIELLSNITGGNMRAVIELITRFISTPNVDSDKIIQTMERTGRYLIPLHEFSKVAILGDYAHYNPESSIAANLFDIAYPDEKEHFLCSLILAYLDYDGQHKNLENFVASNSIIAEMQELGFVPPQTQNALRKLTNKRLIETSERVTFEEDALGELIGELPGTFRTTTVGSYHLKKWIGTFGYLDAMAFDTPIFSDESMSKLSASADSFEIVVRYKRTEYFREYLSRVWERSGISRPYFDWKQCVSVGDPTFHSIANVIARQGKALPH